MPKVMIKIFLNLSGGINIVYNCDDTDKHIQYAQLTPLAHILPNIKFLQTHLLIALNNCSII
ncbi:MAG TPA: hypothetical protein DCX36_03690 [Leuconostoc mesenteroides]|nr:hypothetical protein [Leuconostoc mesenteroides]